MLLQEYGWPSSFPLPSSKYSSLIKRQAALYQERIDRWENNLDQKWSLLTNHWHEVKKMDWQDPETQKLKCLDDQIKSILSRHSRKMEDREYALIADLPFDKQYEQATILLPSAHIGEDWRVDTTPSMTMDRFNEVMSANGPVTNTHELRKVMDAAYERYELSQKGIYPPDVVDGDDDDETSDYAPSEVEEECSDEEEWETDEEDGELEFDIVLLEEDIKTDIEDLRKQLAEYELLQV